MTCEEARPLIHGYADAELDLAGSLEIERHLAQCTACAAAYREIGVLRSVLRLGLVNFEAPATLRASLPCRKRVSAPAPAAMRRSRHAPMGNGRAAATARASRAVVVCLAPWIPRSVDFGEVAARPPTSGSLGSGLRAWDAPAKAPHLTK